MENVQELEARVSELAMALGRALRRAEDVMEVCDESDVDDATRFQQLRAWAVRDCNQIRSVLNG